VDLTGPTFKGGEGPTSKARGRGERKRLAPASKNKLRPCLMVLTVSNTISIGLSVNYLLFYLNNPTHTHPFNGPVSGTTRVSRYQKGKTNLDFTEARDSEW